jgi:hypothetical protein
MVTPGDVKTYIEESLDCEHIEVNGDGQHFEAVIVSASFESKKSGTKASDRLRGAWRAYEGRNSCPIDENAHAC